MTPNVFAQSNLSKYEKRWVLIYPITALKIIQHLKETTSQYAIVKRDKILDTLDSGGKLDAFRHSFTMAYLARFVSVKKLRALGLAHEKGNQLNFFKFHLEFGERADSLACEMDLRNNELGFLIGIANEKMKIEDLKTLIVKEILAGKAWYLMRNAKNEYTKCDGTPFQINDYKYQWFVPKCLIKSSE